jgi:ferredoxin-like protein FixX
MHLMLLNCIMTLTVPQASLKKFCTTNPVQQKTCSSILFEWDVCLECGSI